MKVYPFHLSLDSAKAPSGLPDVGKGNVNKDDENRLTYLGGGGENKTNGNVNDIDIEDKMPW